MAGGNRPEDRRGGKSRALCCGKDIGALYVVGKPRPRDVFELSGTKHRVVDDTVLVGIAAGGHGGVAGICDRRPNGAGAFYARALGIQVAKARAGPQQIFYILIDHRVAGKDNYFALCHFYGSFLVMDGRHGECPPHKTLLSHYNYSVSAADSQAKRQKMSQKTPRRLSRARKGI